MSASIATVSKVKIALGPKPIANPVKVETAALPGLVEIKPPRMAAFLSKQVPEEELPRVWRVGAAEVETLCLVALPSILKRFPRAQLEGLVSYVNSIMHTNAARVVRTENAWGIAVLENDFLDSRPHVREVGMFKIKTSVRDPIALHYDFLRWGKDVKACEYRYGAELGVDIEPFAKRVGYEFKRISYVKVL